MTHDPICVKADLQALIPVDWEKPNVCQLEYLCICEYLEEARNDERDKSERED